jgi:hypothetical protein
MIQKKASDSLNCSDLVPKYQTHEDRCWNFKRFLTPLALGTMTLAARMGGVEARPEAPSSALQRKEHDNTTNLPPAFHQQEFNNLSHPTALEFNPHKVTPELLDHLSKFVKNPEKFAQNVQKRDHPQSIQKRGQRQRIRRLVEKAREHPEVLESLKKLFEEVPEQNHRKLLAESRPPSEQDKGTEHLTPEKIDQEVLENTKRKLYEECLQWLSVKGVLGSTTIVDGPLSGEGTTVELSLQADNNCGGTVDNVQFNAGITYTCPSECKPGNGGSVGEVGGQEVVENGAPSTIENGQLSQAQLITAAFCQQVDSNGDVTAILPPSSVSALVTTLGTYNGEVVQTPVQPVSFVS